MIEATTRESTHASGFDRGLPVRNKCFMLPAPRFWVGHVQAHSLPGRGNTKGLQDLTHMIDVKGDVIVNNPLCPRC
jgi:hypothetical protein